VLALVVALVLGWSGFVPASLGALGGFYGLQLAVDDAPVDLAAPLVAAGLVAVAELAYWSLEERERIEGEPGDAFRRLGYLAGLVLATFVVASLLLATVDAARTEGLAIDLLGAGAAVAVLLAIAFAGRQSLRPAEHGSGSARTGDEP
jgi:hypothetical protein